MDVASELKRQRAMAEKQLAISEEKQRIKEKILHSTKFTGEQLGDEEIDAAIDHFYRGLYTYSRPVRNIEYYLARLYIIRGWLATYLILPLATVILCVVGVDYYTSSQAQKYEATSLRKRQQNYEVGKAIRDKLLDSGKTQEVRISVEEYFAEIESDCASPLGELDACDASLQSFTALAKQITTQCTIAVVAEPGVKSGIDRYYYDQQGQRISGYYLIVEARDSKGTLIPYRITDAETGKAVTVSRWGERVSQDVYEQVKRDKLEDGILDKRVFARKALWVLRA